MGCSQIRSETNYAVQFSKPIEGESGIYRGLSYNEKLHNSEKSEIKTLKDSFLNSVKLYSKTNFLGTKNVQNGKYRYKTYKQSENLAKRVGSGICNLNLAPVLSKIDEQDLKLIAVFSKNCEEWMLVDLASCLYGFSIIPFYDDFSKQNIRF